MRGLRPPVLVSPPPSFLFAPPSAPAPVPCRRSSLPLALVTELWVDLTQPSCAGASAIPTRASLPWHCEYPAVSPAPALALQPVLLQRQPVLEWQPPAQLLSQPMAHRWRDPASAAAGAAAAAGLVGPRRDHIDPAAGRQRPAGCLRCASVLQSRRRHPRSQSNHRQQSARRRQWRRRRLGASLRAAAQARRRRLALCLDQLAARVGTAASSACFLGRPPGWAPGRRALG